MIKLNCPEEIGSYKELEKALVPHPDDLKLVEVLQNASDDHKETLERVRCLFEEVDFDVRSPGVDTVSVKLTSYLPLQYIGMGMEFQIDFYDSESAEARQAKWARFIAFLKSFLEKEEIICRVGVPTVSKWEIREE